MNKTTLKEIAEALDISISTVSKALKDYPDVSKKTKLKVIKMAEQVNYLPNSFAQSLRSKTSKIIGVIIPSMVHYFFSNIIDSILREAESKGYLVIIMQSNEDYELEKKQVDLLLRQGVDGILISLASSTNDFKHLKRILDFGVPLVLFDKIAKVVPCSKVVINDIKASYNAVEYLIKKGCKRIAYFRGDLNPQNSIDRYLGYKKALEDNEIPFDKTLVYICSKADFNSGYNAAKQLIKDHGSSVDALHTITDLTAIGAINYFNSKNIKIPQDIAVLGFSNWYMSSVITPTLSSVEQNASKIGEESIKVLLNEIELKKKGIPFKPKKILIDTQLILRNSC